MNQDILLICYRTEDFDQLKIALEQAQIIVAQTEETKTAMPSLEQHSPAFLLLDSDIENAEGFLQEVSESILLNPPPYILMADTFLDNLDRAIALDMGADACVAKPISSQEVIALIRAVLRRKHKFARLQKSEMIAPIEYMDLKIDRMRRTVTMRGEFITLAPKEFDILNLLAEHPGSVLSKETIYELVWKENPEYESNRVTDIIHSLRHKLNLDSKDTDYIQTVHRIGYRFAPSVNSEESRNNKAEM